jgi:CheY-like chemotaxis protein/two-component sensor histidine kinase
MEAIGTLAGGIAHDFNNILGAIMGYTEMTVLTIPKESKAGETLEEVLKATHRAKELVKQIINFSRQSKEERIPTKLSFIIKEVSKLIRASLPATVELHQEFTTENDAIVADPIQIHQVLMNLCTNAHHAMDKNGGVIEVSLKAVDLDAKNAFQYPNLKPGSYVELTISDTGQGMDQYTLERIFDPYFTTKEKGMGTGLGLAAVHSIIKSHGGAINVESSPGEGSKFKIYFPLVEMEATSVIDVSELYPIGNERVLFVDDEEPLVDLAHRLLSHLGYDVTALTSSVKALEVFREKPYNYDLIITDQTMPGLTGEMLSREIMGIRSDIPMILCSGFSEDIKEEQLKNIGIKAFIMKPLVLKDIAQTIRLVLDE